MEYLALSIGPIYQTIRQARKTRELWAASYLFSTLMKILVEELKDQVIILSPTVSIDKSRTLYGAGLYPDRLFAQLKEDHTIDIELIKQKAIKKVSKETLPKALKGQEEKATNFWKRYIRIVHAVVELDPNHEGSIILILNGYLDTLELQPSYIEKLEDDEIDFLLAYLENPYKADIAEALFDDNRGCYQGLITSNSLFPSTADISTLELFQHANAEYKAIRQEVIEKNGTEDNEEKDDNLQIFFDSLFFSDQDRYLALRAKASDYHKYFCIVHVDGDSFGDTIEALVNRPDILQGFSEDLSRFAAEAASIVNDYGGKPVYIGGDDLVFFTPVRSTKGTVFDLLQALDTEFKQEKYGFNPRPTLSYGLTITYYKYPLFEAHALSYDQLVYRAKKFERANGRKKDAIAFRLLKHSGTYFEGIIGKEDIKYLTEFAKTEEALPLTFLKSIMYKLDTLGVVIKGLVSEQEISISHLDNLFRNYFNEPIHRQYRVQLDTVKILAHRLLSTQPNVDGKPVDTINNLYAILRILDFITPKIKTINESVI